MSQSSWYFPIAINVVMSCFASAVLFHIIPKFKEMFIKAGLSGTDMNKIPSVPIQSTAQNPSALEKPILPEAQGVLSGAVYLIVVFLFIPVPFLRHFTTSDVQFPHHEFVDFLAALLSMCCMLFLGFADDVLNLMWRHKLWLPTMASLPLLMIYFISFHHTIIIIPKPFRDMFGFSLDLGVLYYIYMGMMAVFCTNAINILAGVNGLEAGQTLIIAATIIFYNCHQLLYSVSQTQAHLFSLYLLIPYIGVSIPILFYNWCPAQIFVGDTFCYFSGMVFAVVSILGHFSKTTLLFFIPQILNFLYSAPQLFKLVPCPRHRLPRINLKTGLLEMSTAKCKESEMRLLGQLAVRLLNALGLLEVTHVKEKENSYLEFNNMTIINLAIKFVGPIHERSLSSLLLIFQVLCSIMALVIRLHVAKYFYDE
ncbi:UDP-N-acetylglucosamine--dolichyl-phosphate N-acetylglucosaminephosphotransferase-like [Watersipora subatra]|uniref:UDP-N-acetylglucosamine--dolichyl-phosphate N-acetylglucosaminephosphotransferase-like n=1 Tax=Watersipora subatra TaxID=2589382 RepID=UPI00355BBBDE